MVVEERIVLLVKISAMVSHKLKSFNFPHYQYMESESRFCLFVLRFYGPVNPKGSCRARSVYLTTRLLGRLSPLSG